MLLFILPFIFAAAGSCSNLLSLQPATATAAEIDNTFAISGSPLGALRSDRFHAREIASIVSGPSDPSPKSQSQDTSQDTTTPDISITSLTVSITATATSTPLPDVPYEHHSDGSAITLAIIVSIIGGALLLTLAGWAWRKQKDKKSFGADHHDAELAKHKISNAGGVTGGASRHYHGNMAEVDARPYQRSPAGQRCVLQID